MKSRGDRLIKRGTVITKINEFWTDFGPTNSSPLKFSVLPYNPGLKEFWRFITTLEDADINTLMTDRQLVIFLHRMYSFYREGKS